MTKRAGLCLAMALIWLVACLGYAQEGAAPAAPEEEKKIVARGEGVIFQNDIATAKEKALDQAKRMAVEQGVGVFISSSTLVQNYQTIDDKILARSVGYLKSYTILKEKTEDGVVMVEIEAIVKTAKLGGDVKGLNLVSRKDYPRLMLMIAEQNIGQEGFSYWWGNTTSIVNMSIVENTMINELSHIDGEQGFLFVDPAVLSGKIQQKDAYQVTSAGISPQAAREIANLTDAQVVVIGTAVATNAGPIMEGLKMTSGQADISVRLVNTDNGEILLTASAQGTGQNIDKKRAGNQALEVATKKLVAQIKEKLATKWVLDRAMVTIDVEGVQSYRMFDSFKQVLAHQIGGVKGVNERKMLKDKAQLDVFLDGKTSLLAKELSLKTFPDFMVRVDEVTPNKLRVTLVPAGGKK